MGEDVRRSVQDLGRISELGRNFGGELKFWGGFLNWEDFKREIQ